MTWGVLFDVPMPVEVYDAVHTEVLQEVGGSIDGLLVHVARATATGFSVLEVWRSRDDFDHYNATLIAPIMARLIGQATPGAEAPSLQEFEVRGLVIPHGGIAR